MRANVPACRGSMIRSGFRVFLKGLVNAGGEEDRRKRRFLLKVFSQQHCGIVATSQNKSDKDGREMESSTLKFHVSAELQS